MDIQKLINDNISGATFVTIDTSTVPTVRKTLDTDNGRIPNPMSDRVVKKHTTGQNVLLVQNKTTNGYENLVKRRLLKEGKDPESFKLSDRKWGVRLKDQPFVAHNNKLYLEVIIMGAGESHYTVDGVKTDKADIPGLSISKKKPAQGGLEDKVELRTVNVDNLTGITINKQTHTL